MGQRFEVRSFESRALHFLISEIGNEVDWADARRFYDYTEELQATRFGWPAFFAHPEPLALTALR